jgi:hypothetical protein
MIDSIAHHGSDDAEIVRTPCDVRKELTYGYAALPMLPECPRRLHEAANIVFAEGQSALERYGLAVILVQPRLRVERVDAGRSTVHEKENDTLDAGSDVGMFAPERARRLRGEQPLESEEPKADGGLSKQRTAGRRSQIREHLFILQKMWCLGLGTASLCRSTAISECQQCPTRRASKEIVRDLEVKRLAITHGSVTPHGDVGSENTNDEREFVMWPTTFDPPDLLALFPPAQRYIIPSSFALALTCKHSCV